MKTISLLSLMVLLSCLPTHPFYLFKQGYIHLRIHMDKISITELYEKPDTPESLKARIDILKQILQFASSKLYLNTKDQFQYYYATGGNAISYMVVASEKYRLKAKEYRFPFVGRIYYIAFFSLEDAKQYAEYLQKENWDVAISGVSGYSSLGWFKDPVYSYHLEYGESELARFVFHELTHNTYWDEKDTVFSETLADFVEEEGTRLYLLHYGKYGELEKFLQELRFEEEAATLKYQYRKKLSELYDNASLSVEEKEKEKEKILGSYRSGLEDLYLKYGKDTGSLKKRRFNNAHFVLSGIYRNEEARKIIQEKYSVCLTKDDTWKCFWENIRKLKNKI